MSILYDSRNTLREQDYLNAVEIAKKRREDELSSLRKLYINKILNNIYSLDDNNSVDVNYENFDFFQWPY